MNIQLRPDAKCDFCGSQSVSNWFPAKPSVTKLHSVEAALVLLSTEGWAACEACAKAVSSLDVEALNARAITGALAGMQDEGSRETLLAFVTNFVPTYLQGFWTSWSGDNFTTTKNDGGSDADRSVA